MWIIVGDPDGYGFVFVIAEIVQLHTHMTS